MNQKSKNILEVIYKTAILLILLAFCLMAGFFAWFINEPRSMPMVTEYISESVKEISPEATVQIDDSTMRWYGWKSPLTLEISKVNIRDAATKNYAYADRLMVKLSPLPLIIGDIKFSEIEVANPKIYISNKKSDETEIGITPEDIQQSILKSLRPKTALFKRIRVLGAEVYVSSGDKTSTIFLDEFTARYARGFEGAELRVNLALTYNNNQTVANLTTLLSKKKSYKTKLYVENFNFDYLKLLGVDLGGYEAEGALSGNFEMFFDAALSLKHASFTLLNNTGGISLSNEKLGIAPKFSSIAAIGKYNNENKTLDIENFSFDAGPAKILINGLAAKFADKKDAYVKGSIRVQDFEVEDLLKYWPNDLALDAREWIRTSLFDGIISSISVNLNIQPGDLEKDRLPEEAIKANIITSGLTVNYMDELTPLKNVEGVVIITGNTLTVKANRGTVGSSQLKAGHAFIPDLMKDTPDIEVTGHVVGPAKDLQPFADVFQSRKKRGFKIKIAGGNQDAKFRLWCPLILDIPIEELGLEIDGSLTKMELPQISKNIDITEANLKLRLDPKTFLLEGEGKINDNPSKIKYEEVTDSSGALKAITEAKINMNTSSFPKFGIKGLDFLSGDLVLDYKLEEGKTSLDYFSADLKNTEINYKKYALLKERGKDARFVMNNLEGKKYHMALSAMDIAIAGNVEFTPEGGDIAKADLSRVQYGNTDLVLNYHQIAKDYYKVNLVGKKGNVVPIIDSYFDNSKSEDSGFYLSINLDEVYAKNDQVIRDLKGFIDCNKIICTKADIKGKIGDNKEIKARLTEQKDGRKLSLIESNDAGSVLKAIDISNNIVGGKLLIETNIAEENAKSRKQGILKINDFSLIKAPVLAKILTVASITGLADILNGSGISFRKLNANFTMYDDLIKIDEGSKMYGESLGITFDGNINTKNKPTVLDIRGAIVPAYLLNSMVGNVPLIGDMLTGGKGGGIFAINYSVKGSPENPDVSVNPLSALAPGFLRNIFK